MCSMRFNRTLMTPCLYFAVLSSLFSVSKLGLSVAEKTVMYVLNCRTDGTVSIGVLHFLLSFQYRDGADGRVSFTLILSP